MKKKAIIALALAALMALSSLTVFALDYYVPEDAQTITARFNLADPEAEGGEFAMVSEDGGLVINITNSTLIYFEDFVPLSDECDEMTQMVREVLFDRTLAEVLDGRNMRVIFEDGEDIEPISIKVLFESIVALDNGIEIENGYGYGYEQENGEEYYGDGTNWTLDHITLNGEVVVNGEILEGAPHPFILETANGNVVMVPLRVVAEALGYDVTWNGELRSVQLGVATHLWIGGYEVHIGRMAPIELTTAPVIVDNLTFVPLEFFRNVLGQAAYAFEGQVVVETESDMM